MLRAHDGFIVACYSRHPLVNWLRDKEIVECEEKTILGIFEASVMMSLALIDTSEKFGIVSTSHFWEQSLTDGIKEMTNINAMDHFAAVETTGGSKACLKASLK